MINQTLDKKEFKGYQMYFAQDVKQAMQKLQSRLKEDLCVCDKTLSVCHNCLVLDKAFQEEIGEGLL